MAVSEKKEKSNERFSKQLRESLAKKFDQFKEWMRPDPKQSAAMQVLIFILKIPVVLMALALSPIFIVVLLLAFLIAL